MKNIIILLITVLFTGSCNSQEKKTILNKKELEPRIDNLVKQYTDLDIFSGVILVAEEGKPVYHKAFGLANRETKTPIILNSKFDIGSMNKTFTKIVILQLLEEGKLNLGDTLGTYLDGFPSTAANKITIEHLLDHSSGYGDYHTRDYGSWSVSQKTIPALVERIKKLPLYFEPGEEQEYSNAGYILLGAIIEKITGITYNENVKNRIVIPLNLTETYVTKRDQVPNRSIGYYKTMRGELLTNEGFDQQPNPDGGFYSTAKDIMTFYTEYFYGNTLVKQETKTQTEEFRMIEPHRETGGAIPQAGGWQGANTAYFEILRDRVSIIVFANMDEPVAEQLGFGILTMIRNKEPKEPSLPAVQNVHRAYSSNGIDYVKKNFTDLIHNFHQTDPKGMILNRIGYDFLQGNLIKEAIEIFQLNTELFPEDPNVWDSLGESYFTSGDMKNALLYYKKALEIDPEMPSALKMLKKLEQNN